MGSEAEIRDVTRAGRLSQTATSEVRTPIQAERPAGPRAEPPSPPGELLLSGRSPGSCQRQHRPGQASPPGTQSGSAGGGSRTRFGRRSRLRRTSYGGSGRGGARTPSSA